MPKEEPVTVPPRKPALPPPAHPLDPVIGILTELSQAVRSVSVEVKTGMENLADGMNTLGGRLDGQSRAAQELATEIRSFVSDKERLKGRVIMLEEIEKERRELQEANGKLDAE